MSDERDRKLERFDEELRGWGRRPPATPSGKAATRVLARIRASRMGPRKARGLAWAAAVLLAVLGVSWIGGRAGRAPLPSPLPEHEAVPLPDNVVLWQLDPETPVYFVIRPAPPGEGGR